MNLIRRFSVWLPFVMLALTSPAFGHGFVISLDSGNKIQAMSGNSGLSLLHNHLFTGSMTALNEAGHGSFSSDASFTIPGDTFSLEVFGPIWYSNGTGGPATIATGVTLTATSYTDETHSMLFSAPNMITFPGNSTSSGILAIPGDDSHNILWQLSGTVNPGVYGIAMRVHGLADGNLATPFIWSDTVVFAPRTLNFASDNQSALDSARWAVFNAAVPEPGTIALSLAGFGSLILAGWWRKRRQA